MKKSLNLQSKVSELGIPRQVQHCSPRTQIREVRQMLQSSRIGSIVILDQGRVAGIFTERDYLMKIGGQEEQSNERPVSQFMTAHPKSVLMEDPITDVLEMMDKGGFRHVIVINADGGLEGVVSIKDLMKFLLQNIADLEESLRDLVACIA